MRRPPETDAPIAPSTYYAARTRPPSARSQRDEHLTKEMCRTHEANYGVYGARKVHAVLLCEGLEVARCTVERLMRAAGLRGVIRAKSPRTTRPAPETARLADLVERQFTASAPNQLWVADITYIRSFSGWVYAAFVIDVFSRTRACPSILLPHRETPRSPTVRMGEAPLEGLTRSPIDASAVLTLNRRPLSGAIARTGWRSDLIEA
ncbi:IS3 family transposase [Streptomyces sp. NPDC058847]|uniref:IS3 family transposase n=1 Tax=Streptomyces sp. NPDC058847 TaxID=3346649 RepID=UPI0036B9C395